MFSQLSHGIIAIVKGTCLALNNCTTRIETESHTGLGSSNRKTTWMACVDKQESRKLIISSILYI